MLLRLPNSLPTTPGAPRVTFTSPASRPVPHSWLNSFGIRCSGPIQLWPWGGVTLTNTAVSWGSLWALQTPPEGSTLSSPYCSRFSSWLALPNSWSVLASHSQPFLSSLTNSEGVCTVYSALPRGSLLYEVCGLGKNCHYQRVSRKAASLKKNWLIFAMAFPALPFASIWQSCVSLHIKGVCIWRKPSHHFLHLPIVLPFLAAFQNTV